MLMAYAGLLVAHVAMAVIAVLLAGAASWHLGFLVLVFHCFGCLVIAVNLDDKRRMRPISNMLWVSVCVLILVLGSWLGISALGEWVTLEDQQQQVDDIWEWPESMQAWASEEDPPRGADEIAYNGILFFSSTDSDGNRILSRMEPAPNVSAVEPGLAEAHSFAEWNGSVYFFAAAMDEADKTGPESLWAIAGQDASNGTARLVKDFGSHSSLRSFYVQNTRFWFKAYLSCGSFTTETFFRSDGTTDGTVDMNTGGNTYKDLVKTCAQVADGNEVVPPLGRLLGIFFFGVLPQTGLAAFLLYQKQMPGLVLNFYGGVYSVIALIYLMSVDHLGKADLFIKATSCLYSGFCYLGLLQLKMGGGSPEWLTQEMRDWAAVIVPASFFAALHFALNIPITTEASPWIVYTVLLLLQMVLALLLRSGLAVLLPVAGLFVLSWKISHEMVSNWGPDLSSELQLMIVLPMMCLFILMVIATAVFCHRNRRAIEAETKEFFFPTIVKLEDVEIAGGTMKSESEPASASKEAWSVPPPPAPLTDALPPDSAPQPSSSSRGANAPRASTAQEAFALADKDGDGVVTAEEMQSFQELQQMDMTMLMQLQKMAMESQGVSGGKDMAKMNAFDPFRAGGADSPEGSDEDC